MLCHSDSDTLAEFARRKNKMELVDMAVDSMRFDEVERGEDGVPRRSSQYTSFSKWLWSKRPWWVRGDADGLFAHLLNTVITLMLIVQVCRVRACCCTSCAVAYMCVHDRLRIRAILLSQNRCQLTDNLIQAHVLPGCIMSFVVGNLVFGLVGFYMGYKTGQENICALPHGINVVLLFAHTLFIIGPVYDETKSPEEALNVRIVLLQGGTVNVCPTC